MPLLSVGFEAGDWSVYAAEGYVASGPVPSPRYVHREAVSGFGGRFSVYVNSLHTPVLSATTARWLHLWFHRGGSTNYWDISFLAEAVAQYTVRIQDDGYVQLRRGSATQTLQATSATALDLSQGYWLAIELTVDNSSGTCNVYLGDSGTPFVTFTGDTKSSNNPSFDGWDQVVFGFNGGGAYIDDLIISTASEGRVSETYGRGVYVKADASVGLTPSTGAQSWKNVLTPSTSTYNASGGSAVEDLYSVDTDELSFGSIDFVVVHGMVAMTNDHQGRLLLKSGSTTETTALFGGSSSFAGQATIFDVDPDTAITWTESGVRAMQLGARTQM